MTSYLELARTLPSPTKEQTRAFAVFITSAHSWYKHLRRTKPSTFVLYLDPNAGRAMVRTADGETTYADHDASTNFHYTWQPTSQYLQRFGYWNYEAAYGSSFQYASTAGVVDTAGPGLRVRTARGEWVLVPPETVDAGTAKVSAFMYSHDPGDAVDRDRREWRLMQFFPRTPLWLGTMEDGDLQRLRDWSAGLPQEIHDGLCTLLDLWQDGTYRREHGVARNALEAVRRRYDAPIASTGDPQYAEFVEVRRQWDQTDSRRKERGLIDVLFAAVEQERQRQIEEMISAMERFLRALRA